MTGNEENCPAAEYTGFDMECSGTWEQEYTVLSQCGEDANMTLAADIFLEAVKWEMSRKCPGEGRQWRGETFQEEDVEVTTSQWSNVLRTCKNTVWSSCCTECGRAESKVRRKQEGPRKHGQPVRQVRRSTVVEGEGGVVCLFVCYHFFFLN